MKKLFTILGVTTIFGTSLLGQVKMPDASPRAQAVQQIGLTQFELDYSRPSVRDRVIFGDVVPYGEVWRTGANLNSTIKFDSDITFGGVDVPAGHYGLYVKPENKQWTVYLYTETDNRGVPSDWSKDKIAAQVNVPVKVKNDKQETFYIGFENLHSKGGDLRFAWDNVMVDVPLLVPSKELALKSIEKTMAGPSDRDYYNAASFYLEEGIELPKALEYITKAVEMRGPEAFWYTRKKALIEYANGNISAAIATAELSLEYAKKANYDSYVKMNEESITQWKLQMRSQKIKKK
jgi:tetratricopeptide (TPR) repeat protein